MKYAYIRSQAGTWPVSWMCRALGVSRGGYYAWLRCPESTRSRADAQLTAQMRAFHRASDGAYGSPRLHRELDKAGVKCSRKRIVRLMRRAGLQGIPKRPFVVTTESEPGVAAAPNLLARRFAPGGVAAWAADLTYIHTTEGFLYFALVMSIESRRIVGHSFSNVRDSALCISALKMALLLQPPAAGTLHHSDRGTTYTSREYQELLEEHCLVASMSRSGNCYDNAVVESLFATMKRELRLGRRKLSRAEARLAINAYVEFYNNTRLHSTLGYCSPLEYERIHYSLNSVS